MHTHSERNRRTRRPVVAVAVVLALGSVLAACGGTSSPATGRSEPAAEPRSGHRPVPRALQGMEAAAEDVVDVVPANRWNTVRTDVAALTTAWRAYRPRAQADGARATDLDGMDRALARLSAAANAGNPPDVMQGSNDVSALVVELSGLYDTPEPVDLGRLDVVGRQIVLDADHRDLAAATLQVDRAHAIWNGTLRDDALRHRGKAVATRMDATVIALRRAAANADFDGLHRRADALLELVDAVERLY